MRVLSYHRRPMGEARLLSVHRRAVNLLTADGEVVTLVAAELGNGPGAVVMEGAPVWPCLLDWSRAVQWVPPGPPAVIAPVLPDLQSRAGLLPLVWGAAEGALLDMAAAGAAHLTEGRWAAALRSLVGLGPGLTPAGDDLLCGYAVALWRAGRRTGLHQALQQIPPSATTPLSRSLLHWAAEGLAGEHHLAWIDSVLAGRANAPDLLLAHGATSGADWAAGALLAVQTLCEEGIPCR